ncbi:MAG: VWA domain-containing protein [Solirubrobacterales bacterium]|nr:VWA domain-containing protein [Solirubrobacterales bacterium]
MSFGAPLALLGLFAIPALVFALNAARRRRRRYAVRFPGAATVAAVAPRGSGMLRRNLPPALFLLALAALVVATARPETTVAVPDERATIVLVTDVSRSMLADDVDPDRLTAAKASARTFLEQVPDELRVGAIAFSETPRTLQSPTVDRPRVLGQIDGLVADGGTATGDALAAALDLLGRGDAGGATPGRGGADDDRPPSAIVLLSDGEATTGQDPFAVADAAAEAGVPIYTVSLGTADATVPAPDGSGYSIPVSPDPESLREIAERSGGRAFDADSADGLDAVYEQLGSQLGTREEARERTAAFAGGGALLLLSAFGLSTLWAGRLP